MIRFLMVVLSITFAVPSFAQDKIFRAANIDLEQNVRLDKLEAEVAKIKSANTLAAVSQLAAKPEPAVAIESPEPIAVESPDRQRGDRRIIDGVEHSRECIDGAWAWLKVVQPATVQTTVSRSVEYVSQPRVQIQTAVSTSTSSRYSTAELQSIIRQKHPGTWRGPRYADVQPRSLAKSHLMNDHGFSSSQVSGLSQNEALILHDYAHGGIIKPYRTGAAMRTEPAYVQQPVAQPRYFQPSAAVQVQAGYGGGCANGQCARPASSTVRRGLFGFRSR